MDLSVVIPCYNEEETVDALLKRVDAACKDARVKTYEIICIRRNVEKEREYYFGVYVY